MVNCIQLKIIDKKSNPCDNKKYQRKRMIGKAIQTQAHAPPTHTKSNKSRMINHNLNFRQS